MPESLTTDAEPFFVCSCKELMRTACYGKPSYQTPEGRRYCVLHLPDDSKSDAFRKAVARRLTSKRPSFHGAYFPDGTKFGSDDFRQGAYFGEATFGGSADFRGCTFARTHFHSATFVGDAIFDKASFITETVFDGATFHGGVSFKAASFNAGVYFRGAKFQGSAKFGGAHFSLAAIFINAVFNETADFGTTSFSGPTSFNSAKFAGRALFEGSENHTAFTITSSLDLQFATFEKPELVSFQNLSLSPSWFVNVDPRQFDFTNVSWEVAKLSEQVENLRKKSVRRPHHRLAVVYRQLALNAKQNSRYDEASRFRYLIMDVVRRETWFGFTFWKLEWWYWAASGYGRKTGHAFMVLVFIWLFWAALYTTVSFAPTEPALTSAQSAQVKNDETGQPLKLSRAITYSLGVMALQKPEPKPVTTAAQALVLIETILGPLQATLFALAVRRKLQEDLSEQ
jgi:uncharacterized protein YjbI with pentapeptide repeats